MGWRISCWILVLSAGAGCYASHERETISAGDAGRGDASTNVPSACASLGLVTVDRVGCLEGVDSEYCLCIPNGYCARTQRPPPCRGIHYAGDAVEFECAQYDPPTGPIDGFCLRSCDDDPCPAGSECRSVADTFGYPMDVERACFVRR